jgi:hypothetical protein
MKTWHVLLDIDKHEDACSIACSMARSNVYSTACSESEACHWGAVDARVTRGAARNARATAATAGHVQPAKPDDSGGGGGGPHRPAVQPGGGGLRAVLGAGGPGAGGPGRADRGRGAGGGPAQLLPLRLRGSASARENPRPDGPHAAGADGPHETGQTHEINSRGAHGLRGAARICAGRLCGPLVRAACTVAAARRAAPSEAVLGEGCRCEARPYAAIERERESLWGCMP